MKTKQRPKKSPSERRAAREVPAEMSIYPNDQGEWFCDVELNGKILKCKWIDGMFREYEETEK